MRLHRLRRLASRPIQGVEALWRHGWLCVALLVCSLHSATASSTAHFRVLVMAEQGGLHQPFVDAAMTWLGQEAARDHFTFDRIDSSAPIDDAFLAKYRLIVQLNYPPYGWTPAAMRAFERYIDEGHGGWIGFHHASLLGYFDGFDLWSWFSGFMGGIQWTNYIASFADGTVHVEDRAHPVMRGLPPSFSIEAEEWYTWDKSPRPEVHVLASVDESSYRPSSSIRMGDHPVIWTNDHVKARNVYIFMGHHAELLQDKNFTRLFHNAIVWAAG